MEIKTTWQHKQCNILSSVAKRFMALLSHSVQSYNCKKAKWPKCFWVTDYKLMCAWCKGEACTGCTVHCALSSWLWWGMMVNCRHHVEKSLHSYSEWLRIFMFTGKRDIDNLNDFNMGICSYIQLILYFIHYRDNKLRHILYSISVCSRNLHHMATQWFRCWFFHIL